VDDDIPLWMTMTVEFWGDETLDEILFVMSTTSGIFDYRIGSDEIRLTRR
jgi:hypothetical protein